MQTVNNRALVGFALALGLVAGLWYFLRTRGDSSRSAEVQPKVAASPESPATAPAAPTADSPAAKPKVTKLTPDERKQLAERIAHAKAARSANTAPAPSLPPNEDGLANDLKTNIRSAMREVIPFLSDCYVKAMPTLENPKSISIKAELTLTGDPDVGTLIDAKQIFDDLGKPLPAGFDDCLRSTFQTLQLPPLAEGDEVKVTYPFVFEDR